MNSFCFIDVQKIDTLIVEVEMMFGGDKDPVTDDPKTKIDTTIEDAMADYNITAVGLTRGMFPKAIIFQQQSTIVTITVVIIIKLILFLQFLFRGNL